MKNKKRLFIGALITIILFGAFANLGEDKSKTTEETKIEEVQEKEEEKKEVEVTPEEKIEKLSKKICGEEYRKYTYCLNSDSIGDGIMIVESDLHDNLTNEWINEGECKNAFEIAKAVYTDDTFTDIGEVRYCVWTKFVDKYGNEEEQTAIKISITRDTFSKFNLESDNADLLYQSLPDTADYYSTRIK